MSSTLRILGCSGGFGAGLRTTSFLLDRDVLIDAGTGVGDLPINELSLIDHIFLTHSHLDHIVSIAFLADAVGAKREKPIMVYGLQATLDALQKKIFANDIWPDFTRIPSPEAPFLRLQAITPGETIAIGGKTIKAIAVNHVLDAVGYLIGSDTKGYLAFSGDTTTCPSFWQELNAVEGLKHVIVETSFPDSQIELARLSKHYCPRLLAEDLKNFRPDIPIRISHTKPGESSLVIDEIKKIYKDYRCLLLSQGERLVF